MARINVGLDPKFLSDQHLIAEAVETVMIVNGFKMNNWSIKGQIPDRFVLGAGHINFFKPKLHYLQRRLNDLNAEITRRKFKAGNVIDLPNSPQVKRFCNDWTPSTIDTDVVRQRIVQRLKTPLKAKSKFHRYMGKPITNLDEFCNQIINSPLHYV
jgi:deoxyribonuclease (pyrimidine dimer)